MTVKEQEMSFLASAEQRSKVLAKDGPAWLKTLREKGLRDFEEQGIPTLYDEEWKYTNLKSLTSQNLTPSKAISLSEAELAPWGYPSLKGPCLVVVNGRVDLNLSKGLDCCPGLMVAPLADVLASNPACFEAYLGRYVETSEHPFAALNTALFEDGPAICLTKGTHLDVPIHIIYVSSSDSEASAHHTRGIFLFEENSAAKLIETFVSIGSGFTFHNVVNEIFLEKCANLDHIKIQRENLMSCHIALAQLDQQEKSVYLSNNIIFGGALTRNDIQVRLDGEFIESTLDGIYVGSGNQIIDNHTRLDHEKPNCNSYQIYKGILDDRAVGVFNGKIFVHQDAQKTDAKQTNQGLLLSRTAILNTKPQLEIFADDVKCTHGATVGQLQDQALFYLQSRGISKSEAQNLLIYAFASEVLEKISILEIREDLESLLYQKLKK